MRRITIIIIAIVFAVIIGVIKEHKDRVLIAAITVMAVICGMYTYTNADTILPAKIHKYQTFYTPEYLEEGEYPDAFLRLYLKGKTVYVKNDFPEPYEPETFQGGDMYSVFHGYNVANYLESVEATMIPDESMNESIVSGNLQDSFENIGFLNDMLRNTVMYTKHEMDWSNFFSYLWYYRDGTKPANIYVNAESLNCPSGIVILWQQQDDTDKWTEDLYIMGRDFYNENF